MTLKDIKVGMKVKVIATPDCVVESAIGNVYRVKEIDDGDWLSFGLDIPNPRGRHGIWWFTPEMLEPVRSHAARILTKKIMVDGTKCRKVLGFEGILGKDELPKEYTRGEPSFYIYTRPPGAYPTGHVYRDGKIQWVKCGATHDVILRLPANVKIDVGDWRFEGIQEGSVWPETTFQELLKWMKAAGARLAAIRKREKDSWKGDEVVEI